MRQTNPSTTSKKSSIPIRLPHDGPINWEYSIHHSQQQQQQQQQRFINHDNNKQNDNKRDETRFGASVRHMMKDFKNKRRRRTLPIDQPPSSEEIEMALQIVLQLEAIQQESKFEVPEHEMNPNNDDNCDDTEEEEKIANDDKEEEDDADYSIGTVVLSTLYTLQSSSTIQEQLQTLQRFKNTLLSRHPSDDTNKASMNDNSMTSPTPTTRKTTTTIPVQVGRFGRSLLSGLYRLLLEWSLSNETTVPLQRAIHSCLQTIETMTIMTATTTATTTKTTDLIGSSIILEQVMNSLWEPSSSSSQLQQQPLNRVWKDPLHVLDVAMNSSLILTRLKHGNTIMFDKVLSFLYHQWGKIPTIPPMIHCPSPEDGTAHPTIPSRRSETIDDSQPDHHSNKNNSDDDEEWVSRGLLVCKLIKILLQPSPQPQPRKLQHDPSSTQEPTSSIPANSMTNTSSGRDNGGSNRVGGNGVVRILPFCDELEALVIDLMNCPSLPGEGFSTLGIVFARLHLNPRELPIHADSDDGNSHLLEQAARKAIRTIQSLTITTTPSSTTSGQKVEDSAMARLSIVQGMSATLDSNALLFEVTSSQDLTCSTPLEECWKYALHVSQVAIDPVTRWAALKGLSTMATRWKQHSDNAMTEEQSLRFEHLIQDTMDVILQAWENPPLRKLGTAIPGIFQALVEFMSDIQRKSLCQSVLNQPVSRKGRYLALEILLPYMTYQERIALLRTEPFLEGVGDRGPNAGVIADLWIKLLGYAWDNNEQTFSEWSKLWIGPLSQALVEGSLSRRKQILAFCVIRLLDLVKRDQSLRNIMSQFVVMLYKAILDTKPSAPAYHLSAEIHEDRISWVYLEFTRIVKMQKFLNTETKSCITNHIPLPRLYSALGHELSYLRISAFLVLETILVDVYDHGLEEEADVWKMVMPLMMKTSEGNEHTNILLQCLFSFLDRLSAREATIEIKSGGGTQQTHPTTTFFSFVNDFVIEKLILKEGLYPGTVSEKEEFSLQLLENLIAFVLQDQSYTTNGCTRNGSIFLRRRAPIEKTTMRRILASLLHQEVFASIFSLLYTQWDTTRVNAFRVLTKLVQAAHESDFMLPEVYSSLEGRINLASRGMYLASSPRQREAQTGSQLLAFAYISLKNLDERNEFLTRIIDCLQGRLTDMQSSLESILKGDDDASLVEEGRQLPLAHGIIHAILLIVRYHNGQVATKAQTNEVTTGRDLYQHYEQLLNIFCSAIQLSLKIVADVRDGESIDGLEDDETSSNDALLAARGSSTPLNVNTGAIGANGTVSRLSNAGTEDDGRRLATQRIVVGTWLLIKETCAAASTVISSKDFTPSPSSVLKVGTLLISTMTSLKHAGAAFAARDSLQEIASTCLRSRDSELKAIPGGWSGRLMAEMSSNETVRDSTLRRSTGYALGFQAMMRSDFSNKMNSSGLCSQIMKNLITYSLPMETEMKQTMLALNCLRDSEDVASLFSFGNAQDKIFLPDTAYEARCRVHALNVLRMLILDAPLSPAVSPFIGDSIISSLLGYTDSSWAVRNSATMVFSAAMLRVVDADKNASNADRTSNQAITMSELFRRYPPLAEFLPAMMRHAVNLQEEQADSQLFPILLLISRAQPMEQSGMVASTQAYPALIFKALENKHLAIRAAAARALVNITTEDKTTSSSSAIIAQCINVLKGVSTEGHRKWNLIDGVLLVLERFIMAFPSVEQRLGAIADQLDSVLRATVDRRGPVVFPPQCIATALNILTRLAITAPFQNHVVTFCSSLASDSRYQNVPSGSLLYRAASASIIELTQDVWNPCDVKALDGKLQQLRVFFSSEIVDVRTASVKTFKKMIYGKIDGALIEKNRAIPAEDTLAKIASMILECTEAETKRAKPHVPTVRRLSRCFLEIFDGYSTLDGCNIKTFADATDSKSCLLWEAAYAMIMYEGFLSESELRPHGETFLTGNAVELLAIQIAAYPGSDACIQDCVKMFTASICRLNNVHASWRSRYSAARALVTSGLLSSSHDESSPIRNALLLEVLKMLQDSDPDVRRCATQAAAQVATLQQETGMTIISSLPSPTLRRLYPSAYGLDDGRHSVDRHLSLLQIITDNTKDLSHYLVSLADELDHSREASDPWNISNASVSREIFEEEDPNSSDERILNSQLVVLELLKSDRGQTILDDPVHVGATGLLEMLRLSLENLVARNARGGIVHDMSRFPSIFPSLHSLLGTVSALIYCDIVADFETKEMAQLCGNLLRFAPELHPEISSALDCLRLAKSRDIATKERIRRCQFLL